MLTAKKIARIVFFAWGCVAFLIAISHLHSLFTLPDPEKETYQVWVPPNVEIRSAKEVESGTFKIILPLEEFKSLVSEKEKILLVYNLSYPSSIQYWWPQENGIFKYSSYVLPLLSKNKTVFFRWTNIFDKENGLVECIPLGRNYILVLIMSIFMIGLGIFFCNWKALCWTYGLFVK